MLADWLERLSRCNRLFVGFSGGLDSTVLLHLLTNCPSLVNKIITIHINHGISGNAQAWQAHCQEFCEALHVPLIIKKIQVNQQSNVEETARLLRYKSFASQMQINDGLLLAHHQDDQAETLLLQLLRGSGIDGLAAMSTEKKFAQGFLFRPLLKESRQTLQTYAQFHQLSWIDDESNQDVRYSRNYLRHQIIPLLSSRWPGAVNNLARASTHCQQAKENLDDLAKIDCPDLMSTQNTVSLTSLIHLNEARMSNILRVWFRLNQVPFPNTATFKRIFYEVIGARQDAEPQVSWSHFCIKRHQNRLYLIKNNDEQERKENIWSNFPLPFCLQSCLGTLVASPSEEGFVIPAKSQLVVRFRQGGESFRWHGQTKTLKKLFQEWQIPSWQRASIPLLYIDEHLAVIVGHAVSDLFYQKRSERVEVFNIGLKNLHHEP